MNTTATTVMPDLCSRHHPMSATTALMLLLKMGIDLRRVDILAEGEHENYKGEIREQRPAPGEEIGRHDQIVLKIGYAGAVGQLPYQFFYGLDSGSATRTDDWEDRAYRLMAPFDAAVVRRMAEAEFEELKHQHSFGDLEHITRFLRLFGFDTSLINDLHEGLLWTAMMPSFNEWAGNAEKVERALKCLFGYDFKIIENVPTKHNIPAKLQYRLGSDTDRLGNETVLGDSFTECDTAITVVMHGVPTRDLKRFLPGQPGHDKLRKVLEICLPSHFTCKIEIEPETKQATLGDKTQAAYLGYSSYTLQAPGRHESY